MRLLLVVAAAAFLAACPPEEPPVSFTLLQANVGNTLLACQDKYIFKLCEKSVEDAIKDNIAALDPDVIAFQEILPDGACDSIVEDDPRFVCHPDNVGGDPSQIHRLLGDAYTYACDERNGYECVAVKKGAGTLGEYVVAPPVESDPSEECDPGFSVGSMELSLASLQLTLVNGHPQSGFIGVCRKKQLDQVFSELATGLSLVSGDWNLDPFAAGDDPSVDAWVENVGDDKRFHYHSGIAERQPPFNTTENALFSGVLDHVASDFLSGSCTTLGETPGTERLDGGDGCDHRALFCSLEGLTPGIAD